jgi:hypothetical protein
MAIRPVNISGGNGFPVKFEIDDDTDHSSLPNSVFFKQADKDFVVRYKDALGNIVDAFLSPGSGGGPTVVANYSALPTLTANTDGIICSYQVPLGAATLPGKTLYVRGVNINSVVTTVLAGNATPVVYSYSLAFGHTAISLATTETATSKAPRRKILGVNQFPAAAALGTQAASIDSNLDVPVVVQPGEFVQVVAKNIGAVTTTGVITFFIDINGYFE